MKLTPEDLEKLQTKQLANIIRKLGEGKTITAREQQMLDDARAEQAILVRAHPPVQTSETVDPNHGVVRAYLDEEPGETYYEGNNL